MKKVNVVFALEMEVDIDENNDYDLDDLDQKISDKLDNEDYELELLGYFEKGKVEANLNLKMIAMNPDEKEKIIIGNHSEVW